MPGKRQKIEGMMYRSFEVRADAIIDEENRTFTASISSEQPVTRRSFFGEPWIETLGHKRGEADLSRLASGAPVLYNHRRSREDRIGVVESAKIVNKRIEATLRLSKREDVNDVWQDIRDGVLRNISVGYAINERTLTRKGEGEPSEYRITAWTPMEVSTVDIPADSGVGIGRHMHSDDFSYRIIDLTDEGTKMKFDNDGNPVAENDDERAQIAAGLATRADGSPFPAPAAAAAPAPASTVVDISAAERTRAREDGVAEGIAAERTRVAEIDALFAPFGATHDAVRTAAIADNTSVEATRTLLLTALGANSTPAGGEAVRVESGEADVDKFKRGASLAIANRAGIVLSDADRAESETAGLRSYTLLEFARQMLAFNNEDTSRMDKQTLVGRAFTTSDFPLLLQDASHVSMLKGWDESAETWQEWCATGNLSDFKIANRVNISSFNDLSQVNEDGEYTYGSMTEEGQTIQLATYGKLFAISRQAIINDDMSAFTRIPQAMGRAASRVVGDIAYGVLTANALLSDGLALFSGAAIGTDHGNLSLGGAAAISADSVGAARQGMARQTDASGSATGLNIRQKHLIVPMALEDVANVLMSSEFNPSDTSSNNRAPNVARNTMTVHSDARLDADSATAWYTAADPSAGDTVEVAFLDGNQSPVLEQQAGWSIDGVEYKVRIDVAAAAMDYRGLQKNAGV